MSRKRCLGYRCIIVGGIFCFIGSFILSQANLVLSIKKKDSFITSKDYGDILIQKSTESSSVNKCSDNEPPILEGKKYSRLDKNREWQKMEASKQYENATSSTYHGSLSVPEDRFPWIKLFRHPLSRQVPDIRCDACRDKTYNLSEIPPVSVVINFCDERLELILRSVHSVLNRTPPSLLREIILVDDYSTHTDLRPVEEGGSGALQQYINFLPKVRYVRLESRSGVVGGRLKGIQEAQGDIFTVLDAHIEVVQGWLEPLASEIGKNPTIVAMPQVDGISEKTWLPEENASGCAIGFLWRLLEHYKPAGDDNPTRFDRNCDRYIKSPVMLGGLFAANKQFFLELGSYDNRMLIWGSENMEFSFRIWQCGGSIVCTQCSHVHHMFRTSHDWKGDSLDINVNKLRTIVVWMDRYAHLTWTLLGKPKVYLPGIESRIQLRKNLKCRDFQWFLKNVWPESYIVDLREDIPYLGKLKSLAKPDSVCLDNTAYVRDCSISIEVMFFRKPGFILKVSNEESCLSQLHGVISWQNCISSESNNVWEVKLHQIIFKPNRKCLTLSAGNSGQLEKFNNQSFKIELQNCESNNVNQQWQWEEYNPPNVFRWRSN